MSNIKIIDPNKNTEFGVNNVITPEQLSISVELTAIKKNRSAIGVSGNKTIIYTGEKPTLISFLGGSDLNNNVKYLTTHYTELNSDFNSKNKDLETLGIKDINIEFNSANAPIVIINFTDTRGKLFELGKDSPYSVFFELPYPIFELTIKGYYGKAVKYKLHLQKFTGGFDYSSGNFEVQCSFIGYTYAFLSDIMMGHLKGISYTRLGKIKLEEKKKNNLNKDFKYYSFSELNSVLTQINTNINNIKNNNIRVKEYAKINEAISPLKEFRDSYKKILLLNSEENFNYGFYHFPGTIRRTNGNDIFYSKITNLIADTNKTISDLVKNVNIYLTGKELREDDFLINKKTNLIEGFFINIPNNLEDFNKGNEFNLSENQFDRLERGIESLSTDNGSIIFVGKVLDNLENFINELEEQINIILPELSQEINEISETSSDFSPTIGNIIKLVCDHIDIFMDCIKEVAFLAENNPTQRLSDLSKIGLDSLDVIDGEKQNLKAFPSYSELVDGVMVDKWIGKVAPNIPEVKFIEDLLNGIIKSGIEDEKTIDILNSPVIKEQWAPINVFDSNFFGLENSYNYLKNDALIDDYLLLIILRSVIYLGYSNKLGILNNTEINNMAKLEANNLYSNIINDVIKLGFKNFSNSPKEFSERVIKLCETSYFKNYTESYIYSDFIKSSIFTKKVSSNIAGETREVYSYNYIIDLINSNVNRSFIPLSINETYKSFYGNFLNVKDNDKVSLRENNKLFFSNYVGSLNSNIDNGSTYIKIVKDIDLNNNYFNYVNSIVNTEINTIDANVNIIDGGVTNKFLKVNYKNFSDLPTNLLFYDPDYISSSNNCPSELKVNNNFNKLFSINSIKENPLELSIYSITDYIKKRGSLNLVDYISLNKNNSFPFLGFESISNNKSNFQHYSLFGSDLYYSQNSVKAKAFLFLHSIPFNGLIGGSLFNSSGLLREDLINKFFNQKSGYIKTPYSWCLFVGALLSRSKGDFSIKFSNGNYSFIPGVEKDNSPNNYQFLISNTITAGPHGNFSFNNRSYNNIDEIILKLPKSVKDEFIELFNDWVSNGFGLIKEQFEIFKPSTTSNQRHVFWNSFNTDLKLFNSAVFNNSILNPNIKSNYDVLLKISEGFSEELQLNDLKSRLANADKGSPFNFFLELKDNSFAVETMFNFLNESRVIVNSTWRIWDEEITYLNSNTPIRVVKTDIENYLIAFFNEFLKLNKDDKVLIEKQEKDLKEKLFTNINNDDIKLNLYIKIKSIYDKWICGEEEKYVGLGNNELYDSFKFIDRSYNDIQKVFKVNLLPMINQLNDNYNQSFYNYLSRVLSDNNFDFFPLPSYINYNNVKDIQDVFKVYTYNSLETSSGPQFICMYSGEKSNSLSDSINFKNDSFDFNVDGTTTPLLADFNSGNENAIPVFLVQYGAGDQSIFKDIKLEQNEYTSSDESLTITNNLINNSQSSIGQNLFDVYINRSYTTKVEMLGNAMIQPLMYFQLNNIPMFRGAYMVIKVNHVITPNTMITNFTGIRTRAKKPKMIDDTTIFLNQFDYLSGVSTEGVSLPIDVNEYSSFVTYKIQENYGLKRQSNNNHDYMIKEVAKFIEYVANLWNKKNNNGDYNQTFDDVLYFSSASQINGGQIIDAKTGRKIHKGFDHKAGLAIDFRPISNIKTNGKIKVEVGSGNYSSEGNKNLIQLFLDTQKNYKGWKDNKIIKTIYLNDDNLINYFNGIVKFEEGHSNHIHMSFYPPIEVVKKISENDLNTFNATQTGQLDNFNAKLLPKTPLKYLGNIKTK
jgi:hypothetical protein